MPAPKLSSAIMAVSVLALAGVGLAASPHAHAATLVTNCGFP